MLDKLINLVKENAGTGIINNNAIPNEKNEQAVETAGTSIMTTLQNALASGRIKDVLGFFKGGASSSPSMVSEATTNYAHDLQQNLGIGESEAISAANQVVPQTMNQLATKTTDPTDNTFDIQDIFNKLSGGKTSGLDLKGMLSRFGAGNLDKDGDGDVDFQDLKSMFAGGTGGLMDKVKGMFN